jgi:hypothetical protein
MGSLSLGQPSPPFRPLPVVNFLDIPDEEYKNALLEEALPSDRAPFRQYLSHRHLGLGIITAVSRWSVICPSRILLTNVT